MMYTLVYLVAFRKIMLKFTGGNVSYRGPGIFYSELEFNLKQVASYRYSFLKIGSRHNVCEVILLLDANGNVLVKIPELVTDWGEVTKWIEACWKPT